MSICRKTLAVFGAFLIAGGACAGTPQVTENLRKVVRNRGIKKLKLFFTQAPASAMTPVDGSGIQVATLATLWNGGPTADALYDDAGSGAGPGVTLATGEFVLDSEVSTGDPEADAMIDGELDAAMAELEAVAGSPSGNPESVGPALAHPVLAPETGNATGIVMAWYGYQQYLDDATVQALALWLGGSAGAPPAQATFAAQLMSYDFTGFAAALTAANGPRRGVVLSFVNAAPAMGMGSGIENCVPFAVAGQN